MNFDDPNNSTTTPPGAFDTTADSEPSEGIDESSAAFEGAIDPTAVSGGASRKLTSGPLVLGLVVVTAVVALYTMRTLSRATAGAFATGDVEKTVDEFVKQLDGAGSTRTMDELFSRRDEALMMLSHDYTSRQVTLENIQRNPFVIFRPQAIAEDGAASSSQADDPDQRKRELERRRAERTDQIGRTVDRLRLQAVLMGTTPVANVSGTYLREGDSLHLEDIDAELQVTKITNNTITLILNEPQLELKSEIVLNLSRN